LKESIDRIEREFAQSQARSEERRNQPSQRSWKDRVVLFVSILVILLCMGVLIAAIVLVTNGDINI